MCVCVCMYVYVCNAKESAYQKIRLKLLIQFYFFQSYRIDNFIHVIESIGSE